MKKYDLLVIFSGSSDHRETNHGLFESSRGDDSNGGGIASLGSVIVEISGKSCFGAVEKNALLVTSRHPVIVEARVTARWNGLVETNRLVVVSRLHDR